MADCTLIPAEGGGYRCRDCGAGPYTDPSARRTCGVRKTKPRRCECGAEVVVRKLAADAYRWHFWCPACRADRGLCPSCNGPDPGLANL